MKHFLTKLTAFMTWIQYLFRKKVLPCIGAMLIEHNAAPPT